MKEPVWLLRVWALAAHERLIAEFGGASGIRDEGRMVAAMERPRQAFAYGVTDLFTLAASYAHAVIQGHPFVDGNKRTGILSAIVFLELNGQSLHVPESDVVRHTLTLASRESTEEDLARWLRESCG
jgi:death-on-curing protein